VSGRGANSGFDIDVATKEDCSIGCVKDLTIFKIVKTNPTRNTNMIKFLILPFMMQFIISFCT
jgi:hypothetical protein